ncbi:MAG: exonuclease subunit SbcD [Clostridia bacterium]|nr:exonuclease subunit SbcD [Clostridia bacterium]
MKIAHTSDWHIGKKLIGRDRSEEFKTVLSEIGDICREKKVELLLVAGDVFDTYTPSAEAEEIFYTAIKEIAKTCAVLIISGNHDDYVRLTAAGSLAEELNIYIIGNNLRKIPCLKRGKCYPVMSDSGYVVFENESGERVYINCLPYPNEARFKEGKSDESFSDKMKRWIDFGQRGNTDNSYPTIFLSHIFAAGGKASESEREIDLGGARAVGLNLFPECVYAALGHLHKKQKLGDHIYYSGAIMRFSFDEAGASKSINIFDLTDNGIENFEQAEITSAKQLVRLQANNAAGGAKVLEANKDAYAELTLNLTAPLTPTELSLLRQYENLVSLKMSVLENADMAYGVSNAEKSASQLFTEYYESQYGEKPSEELLGLFLSLTEEE